MNLGSNTWKSHGLGACNLFANRRFLCLFWVERLTLVFFFPQSEFYEAGDRKFESVEFVAADVTIGVELEMIVLPGSRDTTIENRVTDETLFARDALQFLANELYSGDSTGADSPQPFAVKRDSTIIPGSKLGGGKGIEVTTPIMKNTSADSKESWRYTVPKMYEALRCNAVRVNRSIEFNSTTALPVHIGLGDNRTYNLPDLKRICKAILLFEKQLDTLHPTCRNPADQFDLKNMLKSCGGNSHFVRLGAVEWLDWVDRVGDIRELIRLVNSSEGMAPGTCAQRYAKHNLFGLNKFGTIEFRQAHGTIDTEVTVNWIQTVIAFVTEAVATLDAEFNTWAEDGFDASVYERFGVGWTPDNAESYWGCN